MAWHTDQNDNRLSAVALRPNKKKMPINKLRLMLALSVNHFTHTSIHVGQPWLAIEIACLYLRDILEQTANKTAMARNSHAFVQPIDWPYVE